MRTLDDFKTPQEAYDWASGKAKAFHIKIGPAFDSMWWAWSIGWDGLLIPSGWQTAGLPWVDWDLEYVLLEVKVWH